MSTQLLEPPQTTARIPDAAYEPDRESASPFTPAELRDFDEDDSEAGRRISKILGLLFIYTAVAMCVVIWWTFRAVGQ